MNNEGPDAELMKLASDEADDAGLKEVELSASALLAFD